MGAIQLTSLATPEVPRAATCKTAGHFHTAWGVGVAGEEDVTAGAGDAVCGATAGAGVPFEQPYKGINMSDPTKSPRSRVFNALFIFSFPPSVAATK